MDRPGPLILSTDSDVRQTEKILALPERPSSDAAVEEVSTSWLRCENEHGVDPGQDAAPRILAAGEIKARREPLDKLILTARGEIDHLYAMVRGAGYALLFCDMTGSVIEHRGQESSARQFAYWGTWLGGVWSESIEGTNGIGTCIAEGRPVTVHRGQHFRARHKDLSCSGAPVFGFDGQMIAVLDVSAVDPNLSERAHGLTGTLTTAAASAIEERYFREHFCREWVIVLEMQETASPVLLAVDGHQRIVGANRAARRCFALDDSGLDAGISLWRLFDRDPALFRRGYDADIAAHLVIAGSDEARPAIVTAPAGGSRGRQSLADPVRHTPNDEGAETGHRPSGVALVDAVGVTAFLPRHLAEKAGGEEPLMQFGSALTERILEALFRPGAKTIDRHRKARDSYLAHMTPPSQGTSKKSTGPTSMPPRPDRSLRCMPGCSFVILTALSISAASTTKKAPNGSEFQDAGYRRRLLLCRLTTRGDVICSPPDEPGPVGRPMQLWVIFAMCRRVATLLLCLDLPKVRAASKVL
jgi:GAF domain